MKRREAILLALSGAVAGGCRRSTGDKIGKEPMKPLEGDHLVPVRVDDSLIIRTIAGLRPYRPSGFVVKREDVNGKVLVHNYGHGGGGVTLSWGSARLAVDLAMPVSGKKCAVIGGGVMGLSTARLLQLQGAEVKIYSAALPPETTSNVAGAQWWPFSVFEKRTPEFSAQYVAAAKFSFQYFQRFVGSEWGVSWRPNYYLSEGPPLDGWIAGPGGVLHELQVDFKDFGPGEHRFSKGHVRRFNTMMIEPSIYLPRLMEQIQISGGKFEVREFASSAEIMMLPEEVIFNCTGLGAGKLFGDSEIIPAKGQLSILMPQPEVQYNLIFGDYYMFPRTDGILLGGTFEKGNWDLVPDENAKQRVIAAHRETFRRMEEA
jgi:D-amino-acid oxidase